MNAQLSAICPRCGFSARHEREVLKRLAQVGREIADNAFGLVGAKGRGAKERPQKASQRISSKPSGSGAKRKARKPQPQGRKG